MCVYKIFYVFEIAWLIFLEIAIQDIVENSDDVERQELMHVIFILGTELGNLNKLLCAKVVCYDLILYKQVYVYKHKFVNLFINVYTVNLQT